MATNAHRKPHGDSSKKRFDVHDSPVSIRRKDGNQAHLTFGDSDMVSCSLDTTVGKLPTSSPLDLRLPDRNQLFLWGAPPSDYSRGDLWIDYPFSQPYNALGADSPDPELARDVRTRVITYTEKIVDEAVAAGMDGSKAKWAVTELLTNATQYARLSDDNTRGGLIRLEWLISREAVEPSLSLAVSNPCPRLFDPSHYPLMSIADFYSMEPSATNGHLGTIALLSFLKPYSSLSYTWELPHEEKICYSMRMFREGDSDRPENFEEIMKPVKVTASKFAENNSPLPYDAEAFARDVKDGLATRTVSISCTV